MKTSNQTELQKQLPARAYNKRILVISFLVTAIFASLSTSLLADDPTPPAPVVAGQPAPEPSGTHYGLFGWLDHSSGYGQGVFPEPFLVDDSDLEVNEARVDWVHTDAHDERDDVVTAEIEKGFGPVTLEIEVPYEVDTLSHPSSTPNGFDNIDLGARCPIYQYVSDNKFIDTTFGVGIEVGIPTYSSLSKDTEVVPKIFNDTKIDQFTLQSIVGYSKLSGSGPDGGLENFEYGFVFGYTIPHEQLPLPHVLQFIPVFELTGETQLNNGDPGHNSLTGNAAVRFNMKTIGRVQPRLGVGYIFPIDNGAREDMHWGVITSLVFEY
jgi:hypothetical protein